MPGEYAWPQGAATGVGSLPGTDADEACRVVAGELPEFPHLPELPGRGPGAGMVGRAAALLVDLHADLQPSGWRVVDRPGADEERAAALLRADLDALEVALHGYPGPVKAQVAGPLTLAAALERSRGERLVADAGARRDLAASLAEGVGAHAADLARRLPGTRVVLQLDEPGLPAVLTGSLPTASGLGRLPAVEPAEAQAHLAAVLAAAADAGAVPVVHCCAADPPAALLHRAGAVAVSFDAARLSTAAVDHLREAVDGGLALWPGIVPATEPVRGWAGQPGDAELARRVLALWRRLDQGPAVAAARSVVTPACGLAGATQEWSRHAYALCRRVAAALVEAARG